MSKTCGRLLPGNRVCTKKMPESGDHAGGCEGDPIYVTNTTAPKQATASMLVTCPVCGYGLHFNCEVSATHAKSCSACKSVISVTVNIHEASPLTPEELKDKRNQHRG